MAEDYHLGVSDRVRVRVVEFNQNTLVPSEWSVMAGEYGVGTQGDIVLPIVGSVAAAGLTVPELNEAIVRGVRSAIGFVNTQTSETSITASVEIVEYRPVYITGSVQQPGAYPYRPGLTVLQVVSLAGGLPRPADTNGWSLERDVINARATLQDATTTVTALLARQARLMAERDGRPEIDFHVDAEGRPLGEEETIPAAVEKAVADETAIFRTRSTEIRSQIEALDRQKTLLESEVASLQQQIEAQDHQMALIGKDLKDVSSLVDRGLSVSSRRLTLERALADVESRALQFQTAAIQVRQDINKSERERASLLDKRQLDISNELAEARLAIDEARRKQATTRNLLAQLALTGPLVAQDAAAEALHETYLLVRQNDAGNVAEETEVAEGARVGPGDTVKVVLREPVQNNQFVLTPNAASERGPAATPPSVPATDTP